MKQERSAGFVVFRRGGHEPLYLILQNSSKLFWDFPKGKIDLQESDEQAAMRELREEAGLDAIRQVPGFREVVEYVYRADYGDEVETVHKTLVMFLAEALKDGVRLSWEHSRFEWVPFEVARKRLKDKKLVVLEKAHDFISANGARNLS